METIKRAIKTGIFIIAFAFLNLQVIAQNVSFTASAPGAVEAGEQFRLTYSLNAKGSDFQSPAFEGFSVLTGPNVSSSSSIQIINGKMTQSSSYTYNYILVAYQPGKFNIPAATIKVDGKEYSSNGLTIEVVKGEAQPTASNPSSSGSNSSAPATVDGSGDVFVTISTDKKSVYQGDKIIATIKLYTKVDIGSFEDYKFPAYSGFWSQDLDAPTQLSFQRENVNGKVYSVALLKRSLIIPQRSGEITIDPFTATVGVRTQVRSNNPFDDFFGGSYRTTTKNISSKPVTIDVKPLPGNKPVGFDGAVGSFQLSSDLSADHVKANEAITLKIKITGTGNLKFISAPKVDFPPDLEVYDPKTTLNSKVTSEGPTGNVTFDYLFIPRFAGTFRIAPVTFSYFDINTKTYKTLTTPEYNITVDKGEGGQEASSGVVQGFTKEDVKLLGQDIRFIKTGFDVDKKQSYLFGTFLFWFIYILVTLIFITIILVRRVQIQQNANQSKVKNRKANKVSMKRLKVAAGFMKQDNQEKFYDEVLRATWGYLSDKLVIPVANLSKDNVSEILSKHNVDEETRKQLMDLLDACEFARFAPAAVSGGLEDIYKKTGELISKLDQKIK